MKISEREKKGKNIEAQQIIVGEEYPSVNFSFCNYRHHLCHRMNILSMMRIYMFVCIEHIYAVMACTIMSLTTYKYIHQNVYIRVWARKKKSIYNDKNEWSIDKANETKT